MDETAAFSSLLLPVFTFAPSTKTNMSEISTEITTTTQETTTPQERNVRARTVNGTGWYHMKMVRVFLRVWEKLMSSIWCQRTQNVNELSCIYSWFALFLDQVLVSLTPVSTNHITRKTRIVDHCHPTTSDCCYSVMCHLFPVR